MIYSREPKQIDISLNQMFVIHSICDRFIDKIILQKSSTDKFLRDILQRLGKPPELGNKSLNRTIHLTLSSGHLDSISLTGKSSEEYSWVKKKHARDSSYVDH